jgi:hypothetical protein
MQDLLVKNNLDVMHYEKNLCENILKTIFGITNTVVAWEDLKECGNGHIFAWLQIVVGGLIKPIAFTC